MAPEIPDKIYFRIGEVARITEIKPHVLRYWEAEFPSIRPEKTNSNQRVYQKKDIETILFIKNLLYEERFTIEGARARLKALRKSADRDAVVRRVEVKNDWNELQSLLDGLEARLRKRIENIGA